MKFIFALVLTALLSFAGALFFSWWIIAIAAFLVALVIHQAAWRSFLAAFLALFILWGIQAALIDAQNEHLLAAKVARILPLGGSYLLLIIVASIIGGLVAGMAALTASFLRKSR